MESSGIIVGVMTRIKGITGAICVVIIAGFVEQISGI